MPKSAPSHKPAPQVGSSAAASVQRTALSALPLADQRPEAQAEQELHAAIQSSPQVQAATQFQAKVSQHIAATTPSVPVQRKAAANGLPAPLKSGVEQLSGISLDHVRVHYNSPRPAQLQAHAYAQGSDIHLAPGQEKHLPHEAWHVVQQAQGRVKPTLQMKSGVPVNDDEGLEREADRMGARALQMRAQVQEPGALRQPGAGDVVQRIAVQITLGEKQEEPVPQEKEKEKVEPQHNDKGNDMEDEKEDKRDEDGISENKDVGESSSMDTSPEGKDGSTLSSEPQPKIVENVINNKTINENKVDHPTVPKNPFAKAIITRIAIVGRPPKLFSGSMGDHTTAFAVHQKGLIVALTGKTLPEALQHILDLLRLAKKLPGMKEETLILSGRKSEIDGAEKKITELHAKALEEFNKNTLLSTQYFQRLVAAYLEFRELIPLSAMNISAISFGLAGKGKSEAKYVNKLVAFESGQKELSQEDIQENILNLLDVKGLIIAMTEPDSSLFTQVVPGIDPKGNRFELFKNVIKQHLMSIKTAFPFAYRMANITSKSMVAKHLLLSHKDSIINITNRNKSFTTQNIEINNKKTDKLLEQILPDANISQKITSDKKKAKNTREASTSIANEILKYIENKNDLPIIKQIPSLELFKGKKIKEIYSSYTEVKAIIEKITSIDKNNEYIDLYKTQLKFLDSLLEGLNQLKPAKEKEVSGGKSNPKEKTTPPNEKDIEQEKTSGSEQKKDTEKKEPLKTRNPLWLGSKALNEEELKSLRSEIQSAKVVIESELIDAEGEEQPEKPQTVAPNSSDLQSPNAQKNPVTNPETSKDLKAEQKAIKEEEKRQPIATEIALDEKGCIADIRSAGRTKSPFISSMGAHSTAWVVHLDEIRQQLIKKDIHDAFEIMDNLCEEAKKRRSRMEKLFKVNNSGGYGTITQYHKKSLKAAETILNNFKSNKMPTQLMMQLPTLQSYINALLGYINLIPGSTFESANTSGHGEGTSRFILSAANRLDITKLFIEKAGKKIRKIISLDQNSPFIIAEIREALIKSKKGLLDVKGVSQPISGELKTLHDKSITKAYPFAMEIMKNKPEALLTLKNKIELLQNEHGGKKPNTKLKNNKKRKKIEPNTFAKNKIAKKTKDHVIQEEDDSDDSEDSDY